MKVATILVLVACLVAVTYGDLICGTNYCKQHPCSTTVAPTSCKTPSVYRAKHSGKCSCCPACVTLLNEGAACKIYTEELGATSTSICKPPLECQRGVCTKVRK